MSYYTAAVCENSHILTSRLAPGQLADKSCSKCGATVYTKCPHCGEKLRGAPRMSTSGGARIEDLQYCHECAEAFPWTRRKLDKAKLAIEQHATEQGISQEETTALQAFADDVVKGSVSEVQVSGARATLQKFGPAGAVIWGGLTDLAAKTIAAMMKP